MTFLKKKITIHPAFVGMCAVMVIFGYAAAALALVLSVTPHELAHALAAKLCGLNVAKWEITPFGQSVRVTGLSQAPLHKRLAVLMAGPAVSLALFGAGMVLAPESFFTYSNLALGLFNLLPAYPLDGGRVFGVFAANRLGALRANKAMAAVSKAIFALIMAMGLLQATLYPYNISLLCVGFYLYKTIDAERAYQSSEILSREPPAILPARFFALRRDMPLIEAVSRVGWDYFSVFLIIEREGIIAAQFTESQLLAHVAQNGASGPIIAAASARDIGSSPF